MEDSSAAGGLIAAHPASSVHKRNFHEGLGMGAGSVLGLQSLYGACQQLYPDQPNPLQVTARLKCWLGGPDPLDYISMYWNAGNSDLGVPPHWHYISLGLSDLHGDGRVHPPPPACGPLPEDHPSGFGLELTMRVLGPAGVPPTWPAALLQRLATYIFTTGNCVCVGDHVSWHKPLDGSETQGSAASALRHMLVAQDPQLPTLHTPLGRVQFVQVVGVTARELRAAQRCGGSPVLAALSTHPKCGAWLLTDMERRQSAEVQGVGEGGLAGLSGVAALCCWEPLLTGPSTAATATESDADTPSTDRAVPELAQTVTEQIKHILQQGLSEMSSSNQFKSSLPPQDTKDKSSQFNANSSLDECKMSIDSTKCSVNIMDIQKSNQSFNSLHSKLFATKKETSMSTDSFKMSDIENALEDVIQLPLKTEEAKSEVVTCNISPEDRQENVERDGNAEIDKASGKAQEISTNCVSLRGVHLVFDAEAASLLPLALRGRVLRGSHFTWSSAGGVAGAQAITLLGTGVSGALCSPTQPIVACNGWLQVLIPEELGSKMVEQLAGLELWGEEEGEGQGRGAEGARSFHWERWGLSISVLPGPPAS